MRFGDLDVWFRNTCYMSHLLIWLTFRQAVRFPKSSTFSGKWYEVPSKNRFVHTSPASIVASCPIYLELNSILTFTHFVAENSMKMTLWMILPLGFWHDDNTRWTVQTDWSKMCTPNEWKFDHLQYHWRSAPASMENQ